jgi:hypothetical protein
MEISIKNVRFKHRHYVALKVINRQIKNLEKHLDSQDPATVPQEDLMEINFRLSSLKQTFKFLQDNDTNISI